MQKNWNVTHSKVVCYILSVFINQCVTNDALKPKYPRTIVYTRISAQEPHQKPQISAQEPRILISRYKHYMVQPSDIKSTVAKKLYRLDNAYPKWEIDPPIVPICKEWMPQMPV